MNEQHFTKFVYKVVPPVRYLSWVLNSLNYFGLSSINPTIIIIAPAKKGSTIPKFNYIYKATILMAGIETIHLLKGN